ncbi:MAG: hypothetical protein ABI330_07865 [Caldimonas sp.]
MKQIWNIAIGALAAMSIVLAVSVSAQTVKTTGSDGTSANNMDEPADMAMQDAAHGGMAAHAAARQLMSTQELAAFHAKMKAAKTSEDRKTLAMAMQTEMEKRAKAKGIKLPAPDAMAGDGRMAQSGAEHSR